MSNIIFNNLKSYQAIALMNAVSNHTGMAVQGKPSCKYVAGNNISATARPNVKIGVNGEKLEFNNQTVEITSGYFAESTLKEIIQETCNDNLITL